MKTPEIIAHYHCETAECPLWHPLEEKLYWTDIPQGKLYRYDPTTGESEQIYTGESVGGLSLQADGSLLLFKAKGTIQRWQEGNITTIIPEIAAEQTGRFNDVIADPKGRVFCGTMPTSEGGGRLYRLDPDRTLTKVLEGIEISNGIGFSLDYQKMYYTESEKRTIHCFDYDAETGEISNQQIWLQTPENEGVPDGLTVDSQGYIWSARWDGSALYRYSPTGEEVLRIPFPAKQVSSLTFGGSNYTDIYITTAGGQDPNENGEGAGAVYHLNLGIQGRPEFVSRITI